MQVVESYGGAYVNEIGLIKEELEYLGVDDSDTANVDERVMSEALVRANIMGDMMLIGAYHG